MTRRTPPEDLPTVIVAAGGRPYSTIPPAPLSPGASIELPLESNFRDREARFRIDGILGEGGTSLVFAAFDEDLEREVAIKYVPATDGSSVEQFHREARVTASLMHPNVPPVYDVGRAGRGYYLSLPRISGRSLRAMIREAKERGDVSAMPPTELVELALKVCDALAFAHSRNIVHQDIKPENIMTGAFGEVMLVDWGAASILGNVDAPTHQVVGTPTYMAPEQAEGREESPAFDVYALGATLFHALFLRKPLTEPDKHAFWERKLKGDLDWPTEKELSRVPRPLYAVIRRAMEQNPLDRFPTAIALADALRNFLAGGLAWSAPIVSESFSDDSYERRWSKTEGSEFRHASGSLVSTSPEGALLFYRERLSGDVALEFDGSMLNGHAPGDLSIIWTEDDVFEQETPRFPRQGSRTYCFQVGALSNHVAGIIQDFHRPLSTQSLRLTPGQTYRIRAEIEEKVMRLYVDGVVVAEYEERFPLRSGYLALYAYYSGKSFSGVRIEQRGLPESMSPLAVGDAFFSRGAFEDAALEYKRVELGQGNRELKGEARYKRGLALVKQGRIEDAFSLWSVLEGEDYSSRVELHRAEVALARSEHDQVLSILRRLFRLDPRFVPRVVRVWSEALESLLDRDERPLRAYLELREELFKDEPTSRSQTARALLALGEYEVVARDFPSERIEYCDALLALGRLDEIVERHGDMTGLRDATLVRLGDFSKVSGSGRSQPFLLVAKGEYRNAAELSDYTVALLGAGEFETLLRRSDTSPAERATALVRLGRDAEATNEAHPLVLLRNGNLDGARISAVTLPMRVKVSAYAAISAYFSVDRGTFLFESRALEKLPMNLAWEDYWCDRFVLLPLCALLFGDEKPLRAALNLLQNQHKRLWSLRAYFFARLVDGRVTQEEFLAQPARGGVLSRLHFALAVRAELTKNPEEALANYEALAALPLEQTFFDSVLLNPTLDYFVAARSAELRKKLQR